MFFLFSQLPIPSHSCISDPRDKVRLLVIRLRNARDSIGFVGSAPNEDVHGQIPCCLRGANHPSGADEERHANDGDGECCQRDGDASVALAAGELFWIFKEAVECRVRRDKHDPGGDEHSSHRRDASLRRHLVAPLDVAVPHMGDVAQGNRQHENDNTEEDLAAAARLRESNVNAQTRNEQCHHGNVAHHVLSVVVRVVVMGLHWVPHFIFMRVMVPLVAVAETHRIRIRIGVAAAVVVLLVRLLICAARGWVSNALLNAEVGRSLGYRLRLWSKCVFLPWTHRATSWRRHNIEIPHGSFVLVVVGMVMMVVAVGMHQRDERENKQGSAAHQQHLRPESLAWHLLILSFFLSSFCQ